MRNNKRIQVMTFVYIILFILVFLVISGRFLYIQVAGQINDVSLDQLSTEKRSTEHVLEAERGRIYDTNGTTLAYDRPTFKVQAILNEDYTLDTNEPIHVEDIGTTAEKLAPILDVEPSFLSDILKTGKQKNSWQVEFGNPGKSLSQKKKEEIEELELPGITFEQESIRYYPNGQFASHIIGLARKEHKTRENDSNETNDDEIVGATGIEKEMNDVLKGEDGYVSYERDGYLNKLLYPNEAVQQPEHGSDIYLTIDQKVQILLEDMLTQVEEEYDPERITAVVMNAKTGEVVGMGNRPSYDPNNPIDVENWYNDAISTPYEPGSTVKMFTWAAAIDAGVYNGNELFKSGKYQINEIVDPVHDHNNGEGWGTISYDEGFYRSSNVAASKLVWEKLGPDQYYDYLKRFDFDEKTNIDLPDESIGKILYNWPIEKITTGFGQGSTLTPIQQMKAATAIANDGKMIEPYVIKHVTDDESNEESKNKPVVVNEPISEKAAQQTRELLQKVVHSENGTGQSYQLNDYTLAGKTGTAEIPNPDGPGYLSGASNTISSFLGMAPADDPELIMYVSVKQPNLESHELSSTPVAHIFTNVMENSLRYLNITPDKESEQLHEPVSVAEIIGRNSAEVEKELEELALNVTVIGDGKEIVDANIEENVELLTNDRVILITDEPTMPNVIDWSLRDILQFADLMELKIETIGNGFVINQSIDEGLPIQTGDYLGVELVPPDSESDSEEEQSNE